jgi:hypothetical protein
MAHTYEELHKTTVAQLRKIAKELDKPIRGYTTMHKEHLLPALCEALGIEAHEHHEVVGINKTKIKAEIKKLKEKRSKALDKHDPKQLKTIRREIHALKRRLRKATV